MCGLVGAYNVELDPDRALDLIAHRGPDGRGIVTVGAATLGHTRLAIQDPTAAAAQPFRDGPVTLTYNGEAWNQRQLRETLPGQWRSSGDTEVLARLLATHGPEGLDQVHGMFASAWHDEHRGTWLARDRYGKIPLYALRSGDRWLWASELKALPHGRRPTPIEPGTAVHVDTGRVVRWATETEPLDATPENVATLLRQAVADRLLSDQPVCFLLSGGLDSSLVLAAARDLHPNPIAYTAVYDTSSPDVIAARRIAAEFEVPLVEVKVGDPDLDSISEAVRVIESQMKAQIEITLANLPLARAIAADGFRVVLSGEAADELFGGYGNLCIAGAKADDDGWRQLRRDQLAKMGRGNFMRVNKVFMAAGVEARLPYMSRPLVDLALAAGKQACPPGKGLLKAAARGILPSWVISRPKDTFQGGTGISAAAARVVSSPTRVYNAEARRIFGYSAKGL